MKKLHESLALKRRNNFIKNLTRLLSSRELQLLKTFRSKVEENNLRVIRVVSGDWSSRYLIFKYLTIAETRISLLSRLKRAKKRMRGSVKFFLEELLKLCSVCWSCLVYNMFRMMNNSSTPSTKWNLLWIIQSLTYINIHKHEIELWLMKITCSREWDSWKIVIEVWLRWRKDVFLFA